MFSSEREQIRLRLATTATDSASTRAGHSTARAGRGPPRSSWRSMSQPGMTNTARVDAGTETQGPRSGALVASPQHARMAISGLARRSRFTAPTAMTLWRKRVLAA